MDREAITSLLFNINNSRSPASTPSAEFPTLSPGDLDPSNTSPTQNPAQEEEMIRYKECQRNHAAHMGQHVLDGCGEFMPAGEEGTPLSLKCAACECHRNFHRRERNCNDPASVTPTTPTFPPMLPAPAPPPALPPPPATTANCYISFNTTTPNGNNNNKPQKNQPIRANHHHQQVQMQQQHHVSPGFQSRAPVMMTFGGAAAESSSEDLHVEQYGSSKKRFRTKFSSDQKDKMLQFADKIGWKIQRQDDNEVQRFCDEVGVKRQVFKVWLHNNKQAMKRNKLENE